MVPDLGLQPYFLEERLKFARPELVQHFNDSSSAIDNDQRRSIENLIEALQKNTILLDKDIRPDHIFENKLKALHQQKNHQVGNQYIKFINYLFNTDFFQVFGRFR